jgi:two-component system nitrate/nitrite response regulator NarL
MTQQPNVEVARGASSDTRLDPAKIRDRIEQILERVGDELESSSTQLEDGHAREVLLDMQVNGMRYTLVRTRPCSSQSQVALSPREQEVARLVTKGLPTKTIAVVLDISPWTVATHLRRVYTKLGVNSRAEMVAFVLKNHLLVDSL